MIKTKIEADGRKFIVHREQDVEPIIERNKRLQTEAQRGDLRHIASIPNVFYERWLNEEYLRGNVSIRLFTEEFDRLVERKLKDPEWAFLRTDNKSNPFYLGWRL